MNQKNPRRKKTASEAQSDKLPRTITFEPDDDVRQLLEEKLKGKSRGAKTKLLNEALRGNIERAAQILEAAERFLQKARGEKPN